MYDWLDTAIADGATVVTSSRRLARELRAVHDRERLAAGQRAWRTPDIRFWQDWLVDTLDAAPHADVPLLLPAAASTLLWEQCLERTSPSDVLSTAAIVRHAREAWQRLCEWNVPLADLARTTGNDEERWFARAAGAYHKRLRERGWLDLAELPERVAALARDGAIALPQHVVCAGFDRVVPALQRVFDCVTDGDGTVNAAPSPERRPTCRITSRADAAAEWRSAGAALRAALERDPRARVGVIAPNLDNEADTVARLVREGFAPGWQLGGGQHRTSVDVAYGKALGDFPLIAVGLLCLQWTHRGLAGSDVSILLRSAFVGDDDLAGRAAIERLLRTLPDRAWHAADLLRVCRRRAADAGSAWQARMAAVTTLRHRLRERTPPAVCAQRIDELLATLGWPGVAQPDSEEFQLINRWRGLLNELARLDAVVPSLTLPEAVRLLARMAANTVYQPESRAGSVRLLGMHEAAGLEFDVLWIGGLDAGSWPPASRPPALLPRRLQRQFAMPDATPADTLAFAAHVFRRRVAAAGAVTASWPRRDQDAELAPSPMLGTADPDAASTDEDPGWFAATLRGAATCEVLAENQGPPVRAGERIRGGAYTVQHMDENPFAAFAIGRLGVSELQPLQPGLSPRQRGSMLHRALQRLLSDKPTRGMLIAWTDRDVAKRIAGAVDAALGEARAHADAVLGRLLELEARRLRALLLEFVSAERGRDDFAVVTTEEPLQLEHGPVMLALRIDRIDRLADGSKLIIDYKTGSERSLLTRDGELADVQLGVYARACDDPIGGLLLIHLDSRAVSYKGVGGSVPWGRIDSDDWAATLAAWRARIDGLLAAFANGDVRINLRLPAGNARGMSVLTRIAELRRGD